jgi:hypothetical protein
MSKLSFFNDTGVFIHNNIMVLNNSKFFAGVIMILLNIGSKLVTVQFSKSVDEYLKYSISKQILIFAMCWMATRDIYTSLILVAIFTVLSEHLFNEESKFCVVPHKHRVLHKLLDTNDDTVVDDKEISNAISVLDRANKERQKKMQKNALMNFSNLNYVTESTMYGV